MKNKKKLFMALSMLTLAFLGVVGVRAKTERASAETVATDRRSTALVTSLESGGESIANGGATNKQIAYRVVGENFARIRYLRPGETAYQTTTETVFTVAATEENNGLWKFYAEDTLGLQSSVITVYMDVSKPIGAVTAADGTAVENGAYVHVPFKYIATDNVGVSRLEYKEPNGSAWVSYQKDTLVSGAGWHSFRAVDRAGQYADEITVFYDDTAPTGEVMNSLGERLEDGAFTNAEYIEYTATDGESGAMKYFVKKPNSEYYEEFTGGSQFAVEGEYSFYCQNKSGLSTNPITVTLDRTKPTGRILADGLGLQSGTQTNVQKIVFEGSDGFGVAAIWVKLPNSSEYVPYTEGTSFTEEGEYAFYVVDNSQNESEIYRVKVDRNIPFAQLYVDGVAVGNQTYTNGAHIRFECDTTCYVKLPNATEFTPYVQGVEYYRPGKYVFYGQTAAGTSSGEYVIVIDRTSKPLSVANVVSGKTDGDVVLDWEDGNPDEFAPMKWVTVNGKEYAKGQTIYTIDGGKYEIFCEDYAGNTWETEFTSTKQNIPTQTLQKQYFEVNDSKGTQYAFTSYERAFAFATAREKESVRKAVWTSAAWDTGIAMDAKDSVNAKKGEYYIYKKSGDSKSEVAYFTEARLNEVLGEYAKVGIRSYYYWEKKPATAAEGENLYAYSDGKNILSTSITIGDNVRCLLNGKPFSRNTIETEGNHLLTVCDEWGNTCEYTLTIVRSTPTVEYAVGEGNKNEVAFDRTYYFKDEVRVSIVDEYDEMAMFRVFDGRGELLGEFTAEEEYLASVSGKYTVEAVNHFGKSNVFTFILSRSAPTITMEEDIVGKKLNILITESADKESNLQTLEIYKSTGKGDWVLLEKDDYGNVISLYESNYSFCTTGSYKVIVTDEFRTGFDGIVAQFDYKQLPPSGILTGVTNGGYTNGKVKFEWTDEATVTLTKDGELLPYKSGKELVENGAYTLTFANKDGYAAVYTFVIDTKAPEVTLTGAINGQAVAGDVFASFTQEGVTAKLYKDGKSLGEYLPDTVITESGSYRIVATDLALNSTEVSFTIDKLVEYDINIYDKGLANSVTVAASEPLTVALIKDGEKVEYALGNAIDKAGSYALALTDEHGNKAELSFVIVPSVVQEFAYNFDEVKGFEKVLEGEEERRLNYGTLELKAGGRYELNVLVEGKSYPVTVTVDDTAPTLTITGVENGGKTTANVVLSAPNEEATVKVYLNESEVSYTPGGKLTGVGKYKVILTDEVGRTTEYAFEILAVKESNTGKIVGITAGALCGVGAAVGVALWLIKRRKGE